MIQRFKATDANRLRQEYNRLVEGLAQQGNLRGMKHECHIYNFCMFKCVRKRFEKISDRDQYGHILCQISNMNHIQICNTKSYSV